MRYVRAEGGTSYAALRVRSANIVNNTIRSSDIRDNDVRSKDIRNNTVTGNDVNEASLGKVGDAETLDGRDAQDFLAQDGTATRASNSDRLQGLTVEQVRAGAGTPQASVTDVESAEVTVGSIGFETRGGPDVTVAVPASGLVSLYAEAEIKTVGGIQFGVVGLFMDGSVFPGLDDCGGGGGGLLKQTANTAYIRTVIRPDTSSTFSSQTRLGAPVVLRTTPGTHTFEVRYVSGDPAFDADFRNRVLSVTPLP